MAPALEISIPTTSIESPSDTKPYTAYHVSLQLPLRKHVFKKRYNDFVALDHDMRSQTGQAAPAPLPAKSWLRTTLNNPALTEDRRRGLERYVQSIVAADDARWRISPAWRAFLNVPGAETGQADADVRKRRQSNSGGVSDPNEWLDTHRSLKSQIQNARQLLSQRDVATTAQSQHALSAEAKASLVRSAISIAQLEDGLRSIMNAAKVNDGGWSGSKILGDGEIRRRRDLLSAAKKEVEGLEGVLKSMVTKTSNASSAPQAGAVASSGDKAALWKGTSAAKPGGRVLGGPLKETERTRELDNSGVLQLQQQIMHEQDEDVLSLGKTVAKLKDMGIMINEELEMQNEMLKMTEADSDRLQGKIDVARRRIGKIS
ncbi:syntaxin [Teratosphaeria destructans]|uniref:Syntaxin n=1 Tax=Teratosphaeria destructans TaxID=418781 RepID=A0A9W7W5V5_9PEZI|nr:syntaxin [Teratosphaeria destructans]